MLRASKEKLPVKKNRFCDQSRSMVLKSIGILYGLILYFPISVVKQWKELSKNCNVLHFLTVVRVSLTKELLLFLC